MLINELEKVAWGETRRLAVFMPPGSAKSTYASILFPPWLLANSAHNIIAASHTTELAEKWGRRVRNLIAEHSPTLGLALAEDSQAAGRWSLKNGAEYYAAGVGTGIAGFRAKLGLIDDPIRSRQDADSELIRDRIWDWYINDFKTRLVPNAAEILIQCMTGDTAVLTPDGNEKPLRDIRPGDRVATYDNGKISTSIVRNWINHGPDRVLAIRMKSGITVKTNARHPFLVEEDGERKWRRTALLEKGNVILKVTGGNGRAFPALNATSRRDAKACACRTTTRAGGKTEYVRRLHLALNIVAGRIYDTATALTYWIMNAFSPDKAAYALSASRITQKRAIRSIGRSFAWITATTADELGDFSATIATTSLDTEALKKSFLPPLSTFEITKDTVLEVIESGVEDVFDIEVERTENFIANGLVSHNTRWHEDDLAGRALNHEEWRVVCLPALAEPNDPLGRRVGQPLWADGDYGYGKQLIELSTKTPARTWSALYQQRPAPEEGDYFRDEWLKPYDKIPARDTLKIYGASDYAVTADGGDYTVHVVVGIDPDWRIFVLDLWRQQASSADWIESFCDLVSYWKPIGWAEEQGQIRAGVGPFLERRMRERRAYVARAQFPTRGDKAVRAQSIRGRAELDGIYVPKAASWYPDFRSELLSFPAGKHDDQVDALGLIGQVLDRMYPGIAPKPVEPMRGANEMTMDEAWRLARPQRPDPDGRI